MYGGAEVGSIEIQPGHGVRVLFLLDPKSNLDKFYQIYDKSHYIIGFKAYGYNQFRELFYPMCHVIWVWLTRILPYESCNFYYLQLTTCFLQLFFF